MDKLVLFSPAKINLHLEILGSRNDGYHDLISLFQTISLSDRLIFELRPASEGIVVEGPFPFPIRENLVYKAAEQFFAKSGIESGLHVNVDKKIPSGSGLGGGSSNAATTLEALNRLFEAGYPMETLCELGNSLGSDVPFFLSRGAAVVTGKGDKIRSIEKSADYEILLVFPCFQVHTGEAYTELDKMRKERGIILSDPLLDENMVAQIYSKKEIKEWPFFNSFYEIIKEKYTVLAEIRKLLYDSGSEYAGLTGSGSCMFGIFASGREASDAERRISCRVSSIVRTTPLDANTEHILE